MERISLESLGYPGFYANVNGWIEDEEGKPRTTYANGCAYLPGHGQVNVAKTLLRVTVGRKSGDNFVYYKDHDRHNNALENIEWVKDKVIYKKKLHPVIQMDIGQEWAEGKTIVQICKERGMTTDQVSKAVKYFKGHLMEIYKDEIIVAKMLESMKKESK